MSKTFATNGLIPERRRYKVLKSNPDIDVKGIKLGKNGKQFRFDRTNSFTVTDGVLAKEITDTHGQNGSQDVVVIPLEANLEDGHLRSVGGSSRWADAWDAFEARRKDKNEKRS